jgi:hypothetical protein
MGMAINKRLVGLLTGIVCYGLSASVAQAVVINEVRPDAGELLTSVNPVDLFQDTTGGLTLGSTGVSLDSITGELINRGAGGAPVDDIDLYKILITDPTAFAVTVAASLSDNNDAMLWLFDNTGTQVPDFDPFSDAIDDGGIGKLPQINPGDLSTSPAGMYFLSINLFLTNPEDVNNGPNGPNGPPTLDNGWFRDPLLFQTGPYALNLSGVQTAPAGVPEPGVLALLSLGLVGLGFTRRKMTA